MIFVKDIKVFAKVWDVKKSEKYIDLNISTSEKDENDNYKNSSWYPRVIGHAFNSLKNVKEGDRITINSFKISREPYDDKDGNKKIAFRFLILEASINDGDTKPTKPTQKEKVVEDSKDEDPWG